MAATVALYEMTRGGQDNDDRVPSLMIERIEELSAQAQQEIEAASSSEAVEQLRVRYLGRKAELPQMLRGVAALEPEQRGLVGKAANVARRALEQLIEQRAALLDATSSTCAWRRTRSTSPCPAPRRNRLAGCTC